jgi:LmbE family N-acetylglucosaminyl deacetylase
MNPYQQFVADSARLVKAAKSLPLGQVDPIVRREVPPDAARALFFAPHPDDECISGGLAVRLRREARMNVINVAVTQGSRKERQAERFRELEQACRYLGFGLLGTGPSGLENVNVKTRERDPGRWAQSVKVIAEILRTQRPQVIFFPHDQDWNSTHIGTHFLVLDALKSMPVDFETCLAETEYWGQMDDPNLMVEIGAEDLADMVAATSFHAGEVRRNSFHVLLPAWMMDNVRRGTELVGGQGGAAPDFTFAALYRVRKWKGGRPIRMFEGGMQLSRSANVGDLFR